MRRILTALALACSAAPASAADPEPQFFRPAQEARVKSLERDVAALQAELAALRAAAAAAAAACPCEACPAPAKVPQASGSTLTGGGVTIRVPVTGRPRLDAAGCPAEAPAAGKRWVKYGAPADPTPWLLEDAPAAAPSLAPGFAPPAGYLRATFAPAGNCAGGRCR